MNQFTNTVRFFLAAYTSWMFTEPGWGPPISEPQFRALLEAEVRPQSFYQPGLESAAPALIDLAVAKYRAWLALPAGERRQI